MKSKVVIFAAVLAAFLLGFAAAKLPVEEVEAAPTAKSPMAQGREVPPGSPATEAPVKEPEWNGGPMHADWPESPEEASEAPPPAVAGEPVALRVQSEVGPAPTFQAVTFLTIQSKVDEVTIKSVELNRGNCAALMTVWESGAHYPSVKSVDESPRTLKFGQELRLEPVGCADNLLEAKVGTSLGDHAFTFDHAVR